MSSVQSVAVVRDPPAELRKSMDRYADEVAARVAAHPHYRVKQLALNVPPPGGGAPAFVRGQYARLVRLPIGIARHSADLFHIIDQGYAHAAALLPYERTIVTCHDLMLLRSKDGSVGFVGRRSSRLRFRWSVSYLRRVAHVVCDTRATEQDVHRLCHVPPERTSVVPPGINESFTPATPPAVAQSRARLRLPDQPLVLQVSTGDPYKNTEGALRAIAALVASGQDVVFVRIGRALSPEQRALATTLQIEDRILDVGLVSETDLVALYGVADVLLHPSFHEGFGWPPLEAMACGTPVVASDIPVHRETLGAAALFSTPGDPRALAEHIQGLLRDPSVQAEFCERGLRRASEFTWDRTINDLLTVYERVSTASPR